VCRHGSRFGQENLGLLDDLLTVFPARQWRMRSDLLDKPFIEQVKAVGRMGAA
jgi:hypothetical protein